MGEALARPYTMDEAAQLCGMSRRVFQEFIKRHPYYRLAGKRRKVFYREDIEQLKEAMRCRSGSEGGRAPRIGTSAAPSAAHLWKRVRELTTETPPKPTGSSERPKSSTVVSLARARPRRS